MPRKKTLAQKINAVRRKVAYVKKDTTIQGYTAVSHDAVTAALRDALIAENLIITPPSVVESRTVDTGQVTGNGTPVIRYEAKYEIAIIDGSDVDGKSISVTIEAHANDTGDKAPGKAMSYATKYFMLKLFNLETGDEDESRVEMADKGRPITTPEYVRLQELIGSIKEKDDFDDNEFIEYLHARGFAGKVIADIPKGIYPIAIAALNKKLQLLEEDVKQ